MLFIRFEDCHVSSPCRSYSSQLSKGGLTTRISSLGDLIYEPTGIWDGDQQAFSVFGLQNLVLLPWIASTDVDAMISKLRHKEITALIIDATVADYITSSNCDLYLVGDLLLPNVIGYLFQPSVPDDYIFLFDSAIRSLDSSGDLLQLQDMYLHPIATCSIKGNDVNTQVITSSITLLSILVAGNQVKFHKHTGAHSDCSGRYWRRLGLCRRRHWTWASFKPSW